ncbi:glycosyltransferase family protein [Chitinimonas koreensis]|uniref:glycosyltransferase family protein n=1 Tax=Chitinimonas koreensis TaxID=356302 RepID=UPI0003F7E348|nr:glycosyltransferase [Chitinimonas koreensis]QNM95043.1 glycosyltransferase [Chitinimonas koreensis]
MSTLRLVTGAYPPDVCGVGDYSHALRQGFDAAGWRAEVYCRKDWRLASLPGHYRALRGSAAVLNIQHPTAGYGGSAVPYLLCALPLKARKVVTLHEYTRKGRAGKLIAQLFFAFADRVVFTSEFERDAALRVAPWLRRKAAVIPIGSNIPMHDPRPAETDIAYFGLIRPGKGIEEFLAVLAAAQLPGGTRIRLIGQVVDGFEAYADTVAAQLAALGGEMVPNRSPDEVAGLLSRTRVALLPFPDGISQRRGSALAAMGNGALVLSTPSQDDPALFEGICLAEPTIDRLARRLEAVLAEPDAWRAVAEAGMRHARQLSWEGIARAYQALF